MTESQKPDDPSPIDPELARILVQERADEAWAEYVMNEQPSALARYLKLGGEVTDGDTAGRKAAHGLAVRAKSTGWDVQIMPAPEGQDWNDVLQRGVAA